MEPTKDHTQRQLQGTKHQKMTKEQVSQKRGILHQINLHQNHQSAAQKTKQ